jgi:hypothetical protein
VLLNTSYYVVRTDIGPNHINPYDRGVVPVAIFGNEELDVTEIDPRSLRFGPIEAPCAHDLTDALDFNEHLEDMNLDGYMDLMTHYRVQETGIECGDTEATLTGRLLDGLFFEDTDTFVTVGCPSTASPPSRLPVQRTRLEDREATTADKVKPKKVD